MSTTPTNHERQLFLASSAIIGATAALARGSRDEALDALEYAGDQLKRVVIDLLADPEPGGNES